MASLVDKAANADSNFQDIPIIDVARIYEDNPDAQKVLAGQVRDASINVGFFYVKNHGIPQEVIDDTISMAKEFFALSNDLKMEIENKKSPSFKGYHPLFSANNDPYGAGDAHEGFEFGWEEQDQAFANANSTGDASGSGVMAGANAWPSQVPDFREKVLKYYHYAVKLGRRLFPLLAAALNLPRDFFDDKTKKSAAIMKLLHYPPQTGPVDDRVIGIGAHTDWEVFTILWQQPDIQALQVLNSNNKWIDAPPVPGTLVINLGDQLARWTNDIFKSSVHRAVNRSGIERYSIPLFFGTDYDIRLEPIEGCVSPERPPRYEVITAGEYIKSRFEATYGSRDTKEI